jgi:hypothetical protein
VDILCHRNTIHPHPDRLVRQDHSKRGSRRRGKRQQDGCKEQSQPQPLPRRRALPSPPQIPCDGREGRRAKAGPSFGRRQPIGTRTHHTTWAPASLADCFPPLLRRSFFVRLGLLRGARSWRLWESWCPAPQHACLLAGRVRPPAARVLVRRSLLAPHCQSRTRVCGRASATAAGRHQVAGGLPRVSCPELVAPPFGTTRGNQRKGAPLGP